MFVYDIDRTCSEISRYIIDQGFETSNTVFDTPNIESIYAEETLDYILGEVLIKSSCLPAYISGAEQKTAGSIISDYICSYDKLLYSEEGMCRDWVRYCIDAAKDLLCHLGSKDLIEPDIWVC